MELDAGVRWVQGCTGCGGSGGQWLGVLGRTGCGGIRYQWVLGCTGCGGVLGGGLQRCWGSWGTGTFVVGAGVDWVWGCRLHWRWVLGCTGCGVHWWWVLTPTVGSLWGLWLSGAVSGLGWVSPTPLTPQPGPWGAWGGTVTSSLMATEVGWLLSPTPSSPAHCPSVLPSPPSPQRHTLHPPAPPLLPIHLSAPPSVPLSHSPSLCPSLTVPLSCCPPLPPASTLAPHQPPPALSLCPHSCSSVPTAVPWSICGAEMLWGPTPDTRVRVLGPAGTPPKPKVKH